MQAFCKNFETGDTKTNIKKTNPGPEINYRLFPLTIRYQNRHQIRYQIRYQIQAISGIPTVTVN